MRYLPGVMAGAKVPVVVNAYRTPAVQVGFVDQETGELHWLTVEPIETGEDGRRADAPVIGEQLRTAPRGLLEKNRDAALQRAYGGADAEEAAANKEAGALAFGGAVDPFKQAREAQLPAYLPRRGTPLPAEARTVEVPRLNPVQACTAPARARLARCATTPPGLRAGSNRTLRRPRGCPKTSSTRLVAQFTPAGQADVHQQPSSGLQLVHAAACSRRRVHECFV